MERVVTYEGQDALAGLRWNRKPARSFWQTPLTAAYWADRAAMLPDGQDLIGTASLLSLLVGGLPEQTARGTILFAFSDPNQDLYFSAVTVDGKPSLAEERLYPDLETLVSEARRECEDGGIDCLAISSDLKSRLKPELRNRKDGSDLKELLIEEPASGYDPVRVEGKKVKESGHLGRLKPVGITLFVAAVVGGAWYWTDEPAPMQHVQRTVSVVTDRSTFEQSCLAAFEEEWPRAPGWDVVHEGCATPGMKDPALKGKSVTGAVAYRVYKLRGDFDNEIALRAAEAVHDGTGVSFSVAQRQLFATKPIQAPPIKVGQGGEADPSAPGPEALRKAAAEAFLGSNGLTVTLAGGSRPRVRVELQGSFDAVLSTAGRLPDTQIDHLSRQNGKVTLELAPLTPRLMTLAAFDKESL